MFCEYIQDCGGCEFENEFELESKCNYVKKLLGLDSVIAFDSPKVGYRTRAEFRIFRETIESKKIISLAMNQKGKNSRIKIKNCVILLPILQHILENFICFVNEAQSNKIESKLYAIELLATINNKAILTLIYHKILDSSLVNEIEKLKIFLENKLSCEVNIVIRSKNNKLILGNDFILDEISIQGESKIIRRNEGQFSQPNAYTNKNMLEFVKDSISSHKKYDLLEMYCGDGNFCLNLANEFNKILASEIVKKAIASLESSLILNNIKNITPIRLSGVETISALNKEREFFRLKNVDLNSFRFSHILVDPPRSGICDVKILEFIATFDYIIYISCNPLSLKNDLEILKKTHFIESSAVFNQFPHTNHIESGVVLKKLESKI